MNRRLSYVQRPLIRRMSPDGPRILWGRRHVFVVLRHFEYLCMTGRLQATSVQMKQYLSHRQQILGKWFNDQVAGVFEAIPGGHVRKRVDKIAGVNAQGPQGTLGDIDVIVVDRHHKHVWSIECKHLNFARTPYELRAEMQRLFDTGQSSLVSRHLRRTEWLRQHLSLLLNGLGIHAHEGWRVAPLIIVEHEMVSSHMRECVIPIVALHQLKNRLVSGHPLSSLLEEWSQSTFVVQPLPLDEEPAAGG